MVTTQRTIDREPYHFGTIKDITERKAQEREIQQQNERLQRPSPSFGYRPAYSAGVGCYTNTVIEARRGLAQW